MSQKTKDSTSCYRKLSDMYLFPLRKLFWFNLILLTFFSWNYNKKQIIWKWDFPWKLCNSKYGIRMESSLEKILATKFLQESSWMHTVRSQMPASANVLLLQFLFKVWSKSPSKPICISFSQESDTVWARTASSLQQRKVEEYPSSCALNKIIPYHILRTHIIALACNPLTLS